MSEIVNIYKINQTLEKNKTFSVRFGIEYEDDLTGEYIETDWFIREKNRDKYFKKILEGDCKSPLDE